MYLSYYGLREEPFRLTPDPRFLHLAEPHRNVLTTLLQGVLFRKGFLIATGPVGTGKTTLLNALLQILNDRFFPDNRLLSAFLVNPTLTREEFLEALVEEFEIPCSSPSKPKRLQALHQALLEAQRRKGTALLIIDEAHLLSLDLLEEIRLLTNADTYREKLLQVVLCGQLELLMLLAQPELRALRQRMAGRCQLRALTLAECRAYVAERLHAAGLRGPSPFSGQTPEVIYAYTQGVPRLINLVCEGCLTLGFMQKQKQVSPSIVEEAATGLDLTPVPVAAAAAAAAATPGPAAALAPPSPSKSSSSGLPARPAPSLANGSPAEMLIETIRQARANLRS